MVWVSKYDASSSATSAQQPFNPFNKLNHHKCIVCEHAFAQDEIIIGYNGSLLNETRGGLAHLACFKPRFAPHITMFGSSMDELSNKEQNVVKEQIHVWQEENKKKRKPPKKSRKRKRKHEEDKDENDNSDASDTEKNQTSTEDAACSSPPPAKKRRLFLSKSSEIATFLSLPQDIWVMLLTFLPHREIVRHVAPVCKWLYQMSTSDALWKVLCYQRTQNNKQFCEKTHDAQLAKYNNNSNREAASSSIPYTWLDTFAVIHKECCLACGTFVPPFQYHKTKKFSDFSNQLQYDYLLDGHCLCSTCKTSKEPFKLLKKTQVRQMYKFIPERALNEMRGVAVMNPFHRNGPPSIRFLTCEVECMKQLVIDRQREDEILAMQRMAREQGIPLNMDRVMRDFQPGQALLHVTLQDYT